MSNGHQRTDKNLDMVIFAIACNNVDLLNRELRKIKYKNRAQWICHHYIPNFNYIFGPSVEHCPLIEAVTRKNIPIIEKLLNSGFDINAVQVYKGLRDFETRTGLHFAVILNYSDVTRYLVERGANPNRRTKFGDEYLTPYQVSLKLGNFRIARILNSDFSFEDLDVDYQDYLKIIETALREQNLDKLRDLKALSGKFKTENNSRVWLWEPRTTDDSEMRPPYVKINHACPMIDDVFWCILILELKIRVNNLILDRRKGTYFYLLHYLAKVFVNYDLSSHPFQTLLDLGADPCRVDDKGLTPSQIILRYNRSAITAGYCVLKDYEDEQSRLKLSYFCKRVIRNRIRCKFYGTERTNRAIQKLNIPQTLINYLKSPPKSNYNLRQINDQTWSIVYHNQESEMKNFGGRKTLSQD